MARTRKLMAALVVVTLVVAACGGSGDGLVITDARIGMPSGPNAAMYFTVQNRTDGADLLEGASTDVAGSVEVHEAILDDHGMMGMRPVDAPLEVPIGGSLVLEPGGLHLMLVDVDRIDVGDEVVVTLTWQNAGEMAIEAEIVDPADAMSHDDDG